MLPLGSVWLLSPSPPTQAPRSGATGSGIHPRGWQATGRGAGARVLIRLLLPLCYSPFCHLPSLTHADLLSEGGVPEVTKLVPSGPRSQLHRC